MELLGKLPNERSDEMFIMLVSGIPAVKEEITIGCQWPSGVVAPIGYQRGYVLDYDRTFGESIFDADSDFWNMLTSTQSCRTQLSK